MQAVDIQGHWLGVRDGGDDVAPPKKLATYFHIAGAGFEGRARVADYVAKGENDRVREADVEGRKNGHHVDFRLSYDSGGQEDETYKGVLSPDGREIAGNFKRGQLTGEFMLRRDLRPAGSTGMVQAREVVHVDRGSQGAVPKPWWRTDLE